MSARERNRFRPTLEAFEDRTVPAVVTVTPLANATEGGAAGTARVWLDAPNPTPITVNYSVSGSATPTSDYTALPGSVTIPAFAGWADITVTAVDDSVTEPTETVSITLTNGTGYTLGTPYITAVVTILDNETPEVYVQSLADAVEGGEVGRFRVWRLGDLSGELPVNVTVGGTATSGTDYTALGSTVTILADYANLEVPITALPDNVVDPGETVSLTVTNGSGYTVGSPYTDFITIVDDPPVIAVTASDTFEGAATGGFSFTRSGGDLSATLTITYTVGGTADDVDDYEALSGIVVFPANVDRVEVPVEAFGDNLPDDGETVIVTIDNGEDDYLIDEEAEEATVTIADQPNTVSVIWVADGEEGVSNGTFRFIRSGDISEELTVYYTVGGSADWENDADYTELSGSVTFDENEDTVDVTVYVTDDGTGEQTETVIVTLVSDEAFIFGSDSATLFIKDDDTRRLVWTNGTEDGLFATAGNWKVMGICTNAAPEETDDLYFLDAGTGDCLDFGYGLTYPLYGLHIGGTYDVVILAQALEVGTFEQTTAALDLVDYDLTTTAAFLWSGGTLGGVAGADVTIDGAAGRLDPPDEGLMSLGSTLNVIDGAAVTVLAGTLQFDGGEGLFIAGEANVRVFTRENVTVTFTNPNALDAIVHVDWDGKLEFVSTDGARGGKCVSELPISNAGTLSILRTVHLIVKGHAGGGNGPSLLQTNGVMNWWTGSNIVTEFGMNIYSGDLQFNVLKENSEAIVQGNLTFGSSSTTPTLGFVGEWSGKFTVGGNITWNKGTYAPRIIGLLATLINDQWNATGQISISAGTVVNPPGFNPDETITVLDRWHLMNADMGITGSLPSLGGGLGTNWQLEITDPPPLPQWLWQSLDFKKK